MEDSPEFRTLTPVDKVYLFLMISEFNKRGAFYKSDIEMSATLGVSEKTIQRARKKFIDLGWIKAKPGSKTRRGQGLATFYHQVDWAKVVPGNYFAQMHRHAFNVMLQKLMKKEFSPPDLVVYVYLCYWQFKTRGIYKDKGGST
jgi:hypothetical protein